MKLTKFLTGAAVAALITGAAQAQPNINGVTLDNVATNAGAFQFTAGTALIASELDLDDAAVSGNLEFSLVADPDDLFVDAVALLRVDLDGFIFDVSVPDDATSCTSDVVVEGGAPGDDFVVIELDLGSCLNGIVINEPAFELLYTGPIGNFSAGLTRASNGAVIGGGTATYEGFVDGDTVFPLVVSSPAVDINVTRGTVTAELPGFEELDTNLVSIVEVELGDAFTTFGGDQFEGSDLEIDLTASFEDVTGLDLELAELGGDTGEVSEDGLSVTFSDIAGGFGEGEEGTFSLEIFESEDAPGAIRAQAVSGLFDAEFAAGADANDFTSSATLGSIAREGSASAFFNWVGDANTVNSSVFRHTGFDPDEPLPTIRVILEDATAGEDFNDEFVVDASGLTLSAGGELVTNSRILGEQIGDYGRANVQFFIEAEGIETQRLISSASGTLSDFTGDFVGDIATATDNSLSDEFNSVLDAVGDNDVLLEAIQTQLDGIEATVNTINTNTAP